MGSLSPQSPDIIHGTPSPTPDPSLPSNASETWWPSLVQTCSLEDPTLHDTDIWWRHWSMCSWQADGKHPTGMLSCWNIQSETLNSQTIANHYKIKWCRVTNDTLECTSIILWLKITEELYTRPYMVTKRRCVWTKHFHWVILCFI